MIVLCRRRNFGHVRPRSYKIQYIPGQQQTFPVPANHSPKLLIFGSIWNAAIIPFSTSKFQAERLQIWRKVINKSKGQFLQVAHLPTLRPSHPPEEPKSKQVICFTTAPDLGPTFITRRHMQICFGDDLLDTSQTNPAGNSPTPIFKIRMPV